MRLCFVTPEYVTEPSYSGGLANYLGRVTVALAQRGHEVHVLTRSGENADLEFHGVRVHRVVPLWDEKKRLDHVDRLVPRAYYNPHQDFKAAWCLWRRWRELKREGERFDVVQVANVSSCGLFFRREHEVAVVTRMSSYRPVWDQSAGISVNKGVRMRWRMEKAAVKGTRWVYAPTRYVADLVQDDYKIPVRVIETPFFAEEEQEDRALFEEQVGDGRPYALFFGRMTQMKGVHVLAQALPTLLRQIPDFRILFVGGPGNAPDGTPMSDYVLKQCEQADPDNTLNWRERVRVLGSQRHDLLYPLIRGAHVVLIPSLMDNLPNTCLEAMGLGRVVVATSGSCFESLIENEKSGLLVPPGDVESLAQGIEKAWCLPPAQRELMGQNALDRIALLHPDRAIPELVRYYEEVIAQHEAKTT